MTRDSVRALSAFGCAALFACTIYSEDLLLDAGGTGGAGGGCSVPADCPGSDGECSARTCEAGSCGMSLATAGAECGGGVQVCDGQGACVQCVTVAHCAPNELCSNNVCVGEGTLPNGDPCSVAEACQSNLCVDDVCCDGGCGGSCEACDGAGSVGSCSAVPEGDDPASECGDDVCNGQGACRCTDGSKNGTESDVDCGGLSCPGCGSGDDCGAPSDCVSGVCQAGQCAPVCGDDQTEGSEQCDDGNTDAFDGCSPACLDPVNHLLISELAVSPAAAEFVEIYNPTGSPISLSDVYLADFNGYYLVTQGSASPSQFDFVARFPPGATLAAGDFAVVSVKPAASFQGAYGFAPDYDLDPADLGAPALVGGDIGSQVGLTDSDEMIVLFRWSSGDLVTDLDYLVYGDTSDAMDKGGVTVGVSTYLAETAPASQLPADNPGSGKSIHRCDTAEATEIQSGGNGSSGHDETSENGTLAWKIADTPSPGSAPTSGFCP